MTTITFINIHTCLFWSSSLGFSWNLSLTGLDLKPSAKYFVEIEIRNELEEPSLLAAV